MDIFHIKFLIINSHKKYYIILFMDDFFKSPHGSYITFFEHLKKEQLRIENEVKEFNSFSLKEEKKAAGFKTKYNQYGDLKERIAGRIYAYVITRYNGNKKFEFLNIGFNKLGRNKIRFREKYDEFNIYPEQKEGLKFELIWSGYFSNAYYLEQEIHKQFKSFRRITYKMNLRTKEPTVKSRECYQLKDKEKIMTFVKRYTEEYGKKFKPI